MTGITRRRVLGLFATTTVGVPLAGCGSDRPGLAAGFSTGQGRAADSAHLKLRNILVVSASTGSGTLLTTIFNEDVTDDRLLDVSLRDGDAIMRPPAVTLPARGVAVIGMDTSLAAEPGTVLLTGTPVKPGYVVWLTFGFHRAAPVKAGAIVVPHEGEYAAVPLPESSR